MAQVGVGIVELVRVVFRDVVVELSVEEGVVVMLKLVALDDEVELGGTVPIPVPVPVPVPAEEVNVNVVTLVEELYDRVMTIDELQTAVEVTVEVSVEVTVPVDICIASELDMLEGCIPFTMLSPFESTLLDVMPSHMQALAYRSTVAVVEHGTIAEVGVGPMMVVTL